ncbi:acyl-CoA dehydrogenase family protein [Halioxenophilus aromaticivorans]|uniref:3-sulfinopropanoyl-CoA desulfinase n=1 Tax=Halioxenophilus aromaticivorans TaxID=1306992 RepID=A0AAV3U0J2_9ALTE
MNFTLTEDQQMIKDAAENFGIKVLLPNASALDTGTQGAKSLFFDNLKKLAALGFMGLNVQSEYGGTDVGPIGFSLAITELARACASTAVTVSVTNMVAEVIQSVASQEQKQKYLPLICSGEYPAAGFCLTEPNAGSDPSAMRTRAVLENGHYMLNGSKTYITSAEFAGVFVVWAVTDPDAPKGKGISCFLVERDTPGVTVGPAEHKMGQHGSPTNPVYFDDCRIPTNALMGQLNKGLQIALGELAGGRIGIGSLALGIGQAAIEYATNYIKERKQFGQSLSEFQGLQWMLADSTTELEAARLLLMQAASTKAAGGQFSAQASMAKLFASEAANRACYTGLQLLGGNGYVKEYPLERLTRDARITTIYEGTSEIQRLIIARNLLR